MFVSLWMSRCPHVIAPTAPVSQAAVMMSRKRVRRLLVTTGGDPAGRLVGIVTLHDVFRAYPPDLNPLSEILPPRHLDPAVETVMSRNPHTIDPTTPIDVAAAFLRDFRIGALPVVTGDRAIGIVTESDVFRAFLELMGTEEAGVRITFAASSDDPNADAALTTAVALAHRHGLRVASVLTAMHDEHPVVIVRVVGSGVEAFVEATWRTGHRVLSVHHVTESRSTSHRGAPPPGTDTSFRSEGPQAARR
jgi:acetoin utilization protein AcuB